MSEYYDAWIMMKLEDLEARAYETFVYPNIALIETKGKELGLKDETIKKAVDMATEYIKKTYHNPQYSHIKFLLPGFVYISSVLNDDRRTQRDIAHTFGVTSSSIRKWYMHIEEIMEIDMPPHN